MTARHFAIRPMRRSDLPAVLKVQADAHPAHYHEPVAALGSRLEAGAGHCLVAERRGDEPDSSADLLGYAFAHPWSGLPPALHEPLHRTGAAASSPEGGAHLFLHDLAVTTEAQGSGVAAALLAGVKASCRHAFVCLVAVGGAESYWARHGFRAAPDVVLPANYGKAVCMTWENASLDA